MKLLVWNWKIMSNKQRNMKTQLKLNKKKNSGNNNNKSSNGKIKRPQYNISIEWKEIAGNIIYLISQTFGSQYKHSIAIFRWNYKQNNSTHIDCIAVDQLSGETWTHTYTMSIFQFKKFTRLKKKTNKQNLKYEIQIIIYSKIDLKQ